jgi:F0F1-type ATP synthase assembly protein I
VTPAIITASVCRTMKEQPQAAMDQPRSQGGEKSDGMDLGLRMLIYGLLGWLGDYYFGTRFLLPIGIVAGAAFGCYVIIRRFGDVDDAELTANAKGRGNQATVTRHTREAEKGER